jgi:outer membrane receptor protein involved in Fe transport
VFESSEDVFTYSVAPRFELSDNASLYARVASGFRPGGPNVLSPASRSIRAPTIRTR